MALTCTAFLLGLAVGLWWGERGRRVDAQRALLIYRPPLTKKARVQSEAALEGTSMDALLSEDQIEKMVRDTMNETGCSRAEAEEDVANMLRAGAVMGLEH